jgi:Protein of unknown function (DUF3421)
VFNFFFAVQVSGQDNWRDGNDGSVPCKNAIIGGYDGGKAVYIVRANTGVGLLPGKLVSRLGQAYVPYNDKEIRVYNYQVLCASRMTQYSWQKYDGPLTNLGLNWVVGGRSGDGDTLYICKVRSNSQDVIGKVLLKVYYCFKFGIISKLKRSTNNNI